VPPTISFGGMEITPVGLESRPPVETEAGESLLILTIVFNKLEIKS
jgi:hypothetical protein